MQKLDTADMHPTALLPSNRAIDTAVKLAAMVPPRQLEPGPSQPETPTVLGLWGGRDGCPCWPLCLWMGAPRVPRLVARLRVTSNPLRALSCSEAARRPFRIRCLSARLG